MINNADVEYEVIENKVLRKIKPSKEEYVLVWNTFNYIKSIVTKYLEKHNVEAEVTLQGSIAKDTWLSGERDLDIFVLFSNRYDREYVKTKGFNILLEAAKEIGRYTLKYAEHPYVRVYVNNVEADIVPAMKIESPENLLTAVDRTPFHTKYVIQHLNEYLRDQVRLLKKFMKNIGVYGAEVKVKGFSGYLCELLVIKYGSFRNVLKEAVNWKPPVYINTLHKPREELKNIYRILRKRYSDSVMFVPDPVDPRRNVAAAVSLKSLAIFSTASYCYLRKPAIEYFIPPKTSLSTLLEEAIHSLKNRCIVFLVFNIHKKLPPENIWGELERLANRLIKIVELYDFRHIYYSTWSDEEKFAVIGIELTSCTLEDYKYHSGPPYNAGERVIKFISKHYNSSPSGPWIDDKGLLKVLTRRKYRYIHDLLVDKASEYLVAPDFKNIKPIIVSGESLTKLNIREKGFLEWFAKFVLRKPVWMKKCMN